jgi:hypothetical protein
MSPRVVADRHRPKVHYSEVTTARLLGTTITALDHYRLKGRLHAVDRGGVLMYDSDEVIALMRARRDRLNAEITADPMSGGKALVYGVGLGALVWLAVGLVWWLA